MNTALLKSVMVRFGDTQSDLANVLNLSLSRTNAKLHERNGAEFTQKEIAVIIRRYNLTPAEYTAIFFATQLSDLDNCV